MITPHEIRLIAEAVVKMITPPDILMDKRKAAEYLGISTGAVAKRVERGQLPCHRKHGQLYFSKNEIDAYLLGDDRNL